MVKLSLRYYKERAKNTNKLGYYKNCLYAKVKTSFYHLKLDLINQLWMNRNEFIKIRFNIFEEKEELRHFEGKHLRPMWNLKIIQVIHLCKRKFGRYRLTQISSYTELLASRYIHWYLKYVCILILRFEEEWWGSREPIVPSLALNHESACS